MAVATLTGPAPLAASHAVHVGGGSPQVGYHAAEARLMIPDAFKGQELDMLKTTAAEFLRKEHPDAKVLRTTIISKDWSEERQWEYTDTSKTAIRYRITQSVTAQIAGKRGNDVFLYTIHIAKDQRSDGSWGALYGHVMFTDPMLGENVKK